LFCQQDGERMGISMRGTSPRLVGRIVIFVVIMILGYVVYVINPTGRGLLAYTLFTLGILYFIFGIVVQGWISRRIEDAKTKYSLSRIITVLTALIFLAAVIAIWAQDPGTVALSVGLIGAAVAFALQDFLKNFAAGLSILASRVYAIGDRIEIQGKLGDVVEVGLLYTTLMEIREWVSGDQATGRLTTVPNGLIITEMVNNYTKDFPYVWDEVSFPIAIDSDLSYAMSRFTEIAHQETKEHARLAEEAMTEVVMEKYYLTKREVEPSVYMTFTDDWVVVFIRYVTRVWDRRTMRSRIFQLCLEEMQRSDKIKIGSDAIGVDMFPELVVSQRSDADEKRGTRGLDRVRAR